MRSLDTKKSGKYDWTMADLLMPRRPCMTSHITCYVPKLIWIKKNNRPLLANNYTNKIINNQGHRPTHSIKYRFDEIVFPNYSRLCPTNSYAIVSKIAQAYIYRPNFTNFSINQCICSFHVVFITKKSWRHNRKLRVLCSGRSFLCWLQIRNQSLKVSQNSFSSPLQ